MENQGNYIDDLMDAAQEFEDNAFHNSLKPNISEKAKAIALRTLTEKISCELGCSICNNTKLFRNKRNKYCRHCGKRLIK